MNECKTKSQIEIEDNQIKETKGKQIPTSSPAIIIGSQHEESG
ncbi:unnamed protein product, partial [Rotaria magnacalcarata]